MTDKILAWHFVKNDGRTQYENILVEPGKTYSTDKEPVLCKVGFHGSERILDALKYAPGSIVCRAELWGKIKRGGDKDVAQNRRELWMLDVTRQLHEFACDVAEETLLKHNVTDERSWDVIRIKRLWLVGKASDQELTAARAMAWVAAAKTAASTAAWSTAFTVAGAALGAAWDDLNARLEARVLEAHEQEQAK